LCLFFIDRLKPRNPQKAIFGKPNRRKMNIIIITGASRGIGRETAKAFCREPGHHVLAISRDGKKLLELADECAGCRSGSIMLPLPLDLKNPDAYDIILEAAGKIGGKIQVLINNAGLLISKPFYDLTPVDFDELFAVNVRSAFLLIKALIARLDNPSHVVNIGSMGGVQGTVKFPGLSLYSASKGALAVMTECLAEELKETGIRMNCLALGSVGTEMLSKAFPGYTAPVDATSMGEFIRDFALRDHRFFNGKIIPVSVSTP
jgi:NAD(P)-dependent dehydrogenase (short-subunit alcohol dehydrogenase family)